MHIRKLEIHGFKSFPDRTTLHFGPGISGVVGPNGCGKSNVLDAVKWCIGEQSPRALRGQVMEDVVFNGAEGRPPMSLAEVSLTLLAGAQPFPGDWARFEEVRITRRMTRGGPSEYLLNQERVRLRDVHDLLLDTGAGARFYAFIEQGRIGGIVESTPEQRRALLEEAAGISRFKARRAETLTRLEATLDNLQRSSHVLQDFEVRLERLGRQVEQAARYRRYRAIARQGALVIALVRAGGLIADRRVLARDQQEGARALETAGRDLNRREGDLVRDREAVELQERRVGGIRDRLASLEASRREHESARLYQDREAADLEDRAERLAGEVRVGLERNERAVMERDAASARATASAEQLSRREADLAVLEEKDRVARARVEEAGQEVARARRRVADTHTDAERARARREGLELQVQEATEALDRLLREQASACEEAERLAHDRIGTEAEHVAATARLGASAAALAEARLALEAASAGARASVEARRAAEQASAAADRDQAAAEGLRTSLEALEARHEGVSDAPRAILERVEGAWLVAEEVEVPGDIVAGLSAVLGDRVDAVALARREDLGPAIEAARGGTAWVVLPGGSSPSPAGLAGRVAGTERARAALARLLGPVEVADDLEAALVHQASNSTVVTGAGDLVLPGGVLRLGGPGTGAGSAVLGRRQALREAEEACARAGDRAEAVRAAALGAAQEAQGALETEDAARTALTAAQEAHRLEELEASGLGHRVRACTEAEERHQRRLQDLAARIEGGTARRAELETALDEAGSDREASTARDRDAQAALEAAEAVLDALGAARSAALQQVQALREEVAALRERVRAEEQARTAAEQAVATFTEAVERARAESVRVASRQRDLADQVAATEAAIVQVAEAQAQASAEVEEERRRLQALREAAARTEEAVARARDVRERAERVLGDLEARLRETRALLEALKRSMEEDQGVSLAGLLDRLDKNGQLVIPHGLSDDARLPLDVRRLPPVEDLVITPGDLAAPDLARTWTEATERARRRLEALEDVNLTAVEEYLEVLHRTEEIRCQRADLEATVAEIRDALARVNRTCRERFRETYQAVDAHFRDLYARLAGGGEARLVLTDEEDLLETGVEIVASPPGKRLKTLGLLSGGENAVVAIALLFALFRVRPSPFCLLDEVDAPLDEANGARFNALLREMSRTSQFVVITHNRKTMEAADILYGVTMPDPGVSRLVTVEVR
ncbi:MAG: chromosome segregation protein SMC [Deltaproteobacteria bacterium]|nr:chromosome segregation protein SMC [Deltaproteobacteria bacterium]